MNYKPKNDEEQAIMTEADKVDRIDDKRQFWQVGMITMWLASVAAIFILPDDATVWLLFLLGALACSVREHFIRRAAMKQARKVRKLAAEYQRKKAIPLFNEMTEKFPDHHVHLDDEGNIAVRKKGDQ